MIKRMGTDERGIAMVVALLAAFVVLLLSTVVVAQSIHTLDSSAYDRRRLLSVNAAEAGLNYWYQELQTTAAVDLNCDAVTLTVDEDLGTTFTTTIAYYQSDATTLTPDCVFADDDLPSYALVSSTGLAGGVVERTMETWIKLTPIYGGFGAAVLAVNGTEFDNSFDIYGDSGNDGDVYVLDGDLNITNSLTINGNVYVPDGAATVENNSVIKGNLWADGDVALANPVTVNGGVLSSNGGIFGVGATGGFIDGGATAYDDIDEVLLTIAGTVSPFTQLQDVPTVEFPQIDYPADTTPWAGYTYVNTYTGASACTDAYNWIRTTWGGSGISNAYILIDATCDLTNGNNHTITIHGNLAVISKGGFNFNQRSNWNGASTVKNVHFISAYQDPATCAATTKKITVGNNTTFNSFVNVLFYTPCTAQMKNQNAFTGQVMAGTVDIDNNFKMSYTPVLVPGLDTVTGFKQDISYIRES